MLLEVGWLALLLTARLQNACAAFAVPTVFAWHVHTLTATWAPLQLPRKSLPVESAVIRCSSLTCMPRRCQDPEPKGTEYGRNVQCRDSAAQPSGALTLHRSGGALSLLRFRPRPLCAALSAPAPLFRRGTGTGPNLEWDAPFSRSGRAESRSRPIMALAPLGYSWMRSQPANLWPEPLNIYPKHQHAFQIMGGSFVWLVLTD